MKRNKPANYDNSWLGVMGVTVATCYDRKGKVVCKTLDAPNPVAYAVQKFKNITKVTGLLGKYNMKEMKERFLSKEFDYEKYIKTSQV